MRSKNRFKVEENNPNEIISRSLCTRCGGSGNLKTAFNGHKTCLNCFGKGYIIENL